ncbi:MAG TPA: lytic murein transglycosylase [Solirubrobacterales bacterium]|nr:lytic murein transglycosylase [Solirubrobacterales bacterium]
MSRTALVIVANAIVTGVLALGAVSANAGIGDVTQGLPDLDGNGVDLPGGGHVDLPGGGNPGGVDLPGGGSVDLPGGEGAPAVPPITGPTAPVPPDGGEPGDGSEEGSGDATVGGDKGDRGKGKGKGKNEGKGKDPKTDAEIREQRNQVNDQIRQPDGVPTISNPTLSLAGFGPAPIGMPNFIIDRFTIPPFLLPIYQACGTEYGIPWYVLASINRIETAFGTNLNVSTAGAQGWMQFMPATWKAYGVDANNDGRKDPYNPVDAICAAANYLDASGAQEDLPGAIFAYNHADWYVDEVLLYARQYANIPGDLVSSITGLTEGARFPVAANSRYADDVAERSTKEGSDLPPSPTRRGINIYSEEGASAVAVNDGTVQKIGKSKRLGKYVVLEDNYGNRFTYAELGSVAEAYPVPRERDSQTEHSERKQKRIQESADTAQPANTEDLRERLSAFPEREGAAPVSFDPSEQAFERLGYESFESQFGALRFDEERMELRRLDEGSKVLAGTILGSVGSGGELAPHLNFAIRPAGRGAPQINPKPILDGWKLLEATHLYRAMGKDPFENSSAEPGQVLLMSKEQAARALVAESGVSLYECGAQDVRSGQIDVRIMRLLLYLARSGFDLTVTSLKCGHGVYTSSGNVSAHSVGSAVDIAQINGLPVLGNQGTGSITETLIEQILELQGAMAPDQVISLMEMGGPTFAMGDHADHVHVGYSISGAPTTGGTLVSQDERVLDSSQWRRLIQRLGEIENPKVKPSKKRRASVAHKGE